ncbi:MAG: redoxin domain-containing protein [Thermoplasmatota archaeon]
MRTLMASLVAAAVLLAGCTSDPAPAPGVDPTMSQTDLEPADYEAVDLSGAPVSLADLAGEPVLLHVWATWCSLCRAEGPEISALHESYAADGLNVVAVSIDTGSADRVQQTVDERGYEYAVWHDPDDVVRPLFDVQYQPNSILLDHEGNVLATWHGRLPGGADGVAPDIEAALAAAQAAQA